MALTTVILFTYSICSLLVLIGAFMLILMGKNWRDIFMTSDIYWLIILGPFAILFLALYGLHQAYGGSGI